MNNKQALMKALLLVFTLAFGNQYALAEYPGGMKGQHGNPEQCKKMRGMHGGGPEQCMQMKKHYNKGVVSEALLILSSDSLQTQGMAMVLGNTMAKSGTKVNVLLCDAAGDLALKKSESALMKPKNVSPKMLLNKLKGQGAQVNVCALYLPNNEFSKNDLLEGVGVAKPNEIAAQMTNRHIRVFTF
jgi:predicted peroxiredoxin